MTESLSRTPLYTQHVALGARMVPFAGWEMPVQYKGIVPEHHAVRTAVGLFDVSHMGELYFDGADAGATLNALVTNDVGKLALGRALYTVACNAQGTILDDLIIYRLADERYMVVCNASNLPKMREHFAREVGSRAVRCTFSDRSAETALLALQGPRSRDVLTALGAGDQLLELARFGVGSGQLAGVDVTVARTGYTGEDGYELFCASSAAPQLWAAAMDAGRASELEPIGLGARDTLRLEARLSLYGHEIDDTTDPLEAGLGWVVKLDKGEFLGRAALLAKKAQPATRKLVGFEMIGRGIARQGYPIVDASGAHIGIVTSGAPSLSLGKNIGLGYVPPAQAAIGSQFGIEIRGKVTPAQVVATPFYKRS
ncbi:MAG TPA: glycine cleavage system aminomethyltransferase GcvT [Polyangiales bacterium]|nr:glycine cleavage system aminomethyltransferase GcvT [Polyangiales bacterium]